MLALLPSTLTHPYAWFVLPNVLSELVSPWMVIVGVELSVIAVEGWVLNYLGVVGWFRWSALANVASYLLGTIIWEAISW